VSLAGRLRARRPEIEQAILARVRVVSGPAGQEDAEYLAGLSETVAAAVENGLVGVERGESWSGLVPAEAVVQARRAARNGVGLENVLRRYVAGYTLLEDFIVQGGEQSGFAGQGKELRQALQTQGALLDRLIASITEEYTREIERASSSCRSVMQDSRSRTRSWLPESTGSRCLSTRRGCSPPSTFRLPRP
jgi:hypothetical protein